MKHKGILYLIALLSIVSVIYSCQKEEFQDVQKKNDTAVLSEQEVELSTHSNEVALILTELAGNEDVQKEVFDAVNMRYEGNYRIMFKHLLNPEQIKSDNKKSGKILSGAFKKEFLNVANNSRLKSASTDTFDIIEYISNNNLEIAWHYSQEWDMNEIPTITFNPLDNDSINIGYRPYYNSENQLVIDTVWVDDDYAFAHPVWIIDQHEDLHQDDPAYDTFLGDEIELSNKKSAMSNPDGSASRNKIYIYQVKTDGKNFRALFGGENKINFRRAGAEVLNGVDKSYHVRVSIDRWAGRKGKWRTPNAVWDENWQPEEVNQWLGVEGVEVHKDKTTKYSGDVSLKFEYKCTGTPAVCSWVPSITAKLFGWEVSIDWKNELWYNNDKSRVDFFYDNWRDANRQGTQDGKCIYKATSGENRGTVYFTFDVEAINY